MGIMSNLCLMLGVPITALGTLSMGADTRPLFAGLAFLLMALVNEVIDRLERRQRETIGSTKRRGC